ncbi:MAG: hypothetical protein HY078_04505 [Elusimicrobia bacterium]|nr:hypothetical protein [Elusimicrobiota bacterium]
MIGRTLGLGSAIAFALVVQVSRASFAGEGGKSLQTVSQIAVFRREALEAFASAPDVKSLLRSKTDQGFTRIGTADAALIMLGHGDEGLSPIFLVSQALEKGDKPYDRMTYCVEAVALRTLRDASKGGAGQGPWEWVVKPVDAGRLWAAVRPLAFK